MKLKGQIYRGHTWEPLPGSTVERSDQFSASGSTDGFQSQPVAGLYRGQAYGYQLTRSLSALSRSADLIYRGVQIYDHDQTDTAFSSAPVQGQAFWGTGIPVQMGNQLASTHHENVMYRLQRRMQSARERGDMELLHQLELEQQA